MVVYKRIWDGNRQRIVPGDEAPRTVRGPRPSAHTGRILELLDKGLGTALIAKRLGCSKPNVSQVKRRYRKRNAMARVVYTLHSGKPIEIDYETDEAAAEATRYIRNFPRNYRKIEILHNDGVREEIKMLDKEDW